MKSNNQINIKATYQMMLILLVAFAIQSCNVNRFIPSDELLYTGTHIQISSDTTVDNLKSIQTEIENLMRPEPNSKVLGSRLGLLVHYKSQREKPGFLNKFLNKRIGEEPVYLSSIKREQTENLILNRLENRGFFYSSVDSETDEKEQKKRASITYTLKLTKPYKMENYLVDKDSLAIYNEIENLNAKSLLKTGMRFDLEVLKLERERIDDGLKEKGYYNFNNDFLIFEADTNQYKNKRFDLFLRLKNEVPQKSVIPYKISKVKVYPNYVMGKEYTDNDTLKLGKKTFFQKEEFFKPKRLLPYILLNEGDMFSPEKSRGTGRRLGSVGAYKFINIQYDEIDSLTTDSLGILEASIFLSPLDKRSVRAELQAVSKSNNFAGPNLALTLTNRNLFSGGEVLNLSVNGGYEFQIASGDQAGLSSTIIGANAELVYPRVLFPFKLSDDWFKYAIPKTRMSLGGDYLSRSKLFSLASMSTNFGYVWNANRFVTHEFNPISINYVNLAKTSPEFEQILEENPFLRSSFEQQFIAGMTYAFTYNGLAEAGKSHQFFLTSTLDIAGNGLSLFSGGESAPQSILGLEYAQYAKADIDVRYHLRLGSDQKLITRVFGGIGVPYGNSEIMPFTKQYFSGGPYSVRAFRIRTLGPGTYAPEAGSNSFFDQSGSIRLEANIEYRFPIITFLKGAIFADAGNVWNSNENEALPGGKFSSSFIDEFGIGTGVGMRIDIQGFVIRFDLAAPLRTPSLPEGDRWDFDYKNPILNFAIGYPF
ncbi:MAG: BamA/TamA family outer membrane protein [Flavobacteriaceae bacterium]|nr:BamA/TamA family outer membrane protein [Flavobacteriaceae bacterium]